jgi:acetyl esterase
MLDPQARKFLDLLAASGRPPLNEVTPQQARDGSEAMSLVTAGPPVAVAEVRDLAIPGPAGTIPARLYVPAGTAPLPVVVYYHGGGFVIGNIAGWDSVLRLLANDSGCAIVSVDYRLAPENKFPAAVDDAYAALEWVAREAATLGVDPNRIAVAGDSAGGNLAAVVTLLARDRSGPRLAFQLLVYPATDQATNRSRYASYQQYGDGYFLTKELMTWFNDQYASPDTRGDWRMQPLYADSLRGLPPAHVIVAECDPLADEGAAYAQRLRAEGVSVTFVSYPGMIHGFFTFPAVLDAGRRAIADAGAVLREALGVKTGAAA